ncbi:MAG: Rne/Rng family ribonuclease [Selenomonadaceae bacterium]|nr:Rne/Rng family ribonuclease [Selenomonadaceae bacterium]
MKKILVSCKHGETTAAVLVDGQLESIYSASDDNPRLSGNIYKGRVQNFLPGMNAVFVDIGRDKNVFLQFKSSQKFSVGQSVLIQIEKESVGTKSARATLNFSLAGRFLIFLPTMGYIGVSNKIRGDERNRLHALAKKIRPTESGLIVRTAAEGCDENILRDELAELQNLWARIIERNSKRKPPALLYNDNDLIEKILRDEPDAENFVVDNLKILRKLNELVTPEKISFHEGDAPIFETFGIADEISDVHKRELPLPSGGQIIFDKTEALTAIDVNTNKFVGRNFDETILRTNLEAAEVILRQLKLRAIGGIIIVDFIDMTSDEHKKILLDFLRERARLDRNKTTIVDMTPLGLVEITRHSSQH